MDNVPTIDIKNIGNHIFWNGTVKFVKFEMVIPLCSSRQKFKIEIKS